MKQSLFLSGLAGNRPALPMSAGRGCPVDKGANTNATTARRSSVQGRETWTQSEV